MSGTSLQKICCQGCGATLPIAEGVRYLTCNYCHSQLEVIRDPEITHTRVIEEIDARTRRIENKLDRIELRERLANLDKQWQTYLSSTLPRDREGALIYPVPGSSFVFGLIGVVITLGITLALWQENWMLGGAALIGGLILTRVLMSGENERHREFHAVRTRYENERRRLQERIHRLGMDPTPVDRDTAFREGRPKLIRPR